MRQTNKSLATAFMSSVQTRKVKDSNEFYEIEAAPSRMSILESRGLKQGPHSTVHFGNGDWYLGTWKNDKKDGNGTYFSAATEGLYEGEWQSDYHCGWGTYSEPMPTEEELLRAEIDKIENGPQKHPKLQSLAQNGKLVSQDTKLLLSRNSNILAGLSQTSAVGAKDHGAVKLTKPGYRPLRKCYAGQWQDSLFHGFGTYYYIDGGIYEGEWEAGRRHGWGKMRFADGNIYTGQWCDGQRQGQGELLLPNGDRYEGMWLNDKKEGPGKFIYREKRHIYQGEWVQDQPRCGTVMDLPPLANMPPKKRLLPDLELLNVQEILDVERQKIVQERLETF